MSYTHTPLPLPLPSLFSLLLPLPSLAHTGLVPRTIGIMPEKAFKMQGWNIVGRYTDMFERPTIFKWILAGSAAGAATTIIG